MVASFCKIFWRKFGVSAVPAAGLYALRAPSLRLGLPATIPHAQEENGVLILTYPTPLRLGDYELEYFLARSIGASNRLGIFHFQVTGAKFLF